MKLTSLANSSAYFDLHNSGFAVKTGWIDSNDGLLVVDRNGDGQINDISELFGNSSTDGFAALSAMDTNGDGVVNALDSGFSTLQVWADADGDGVTDSGELKSLSSLGITGINLNATETNVTTNGNVLGALGAFTKADGTTGMTACCTCGMV